MLSHPLVKIAVDILAQAWPAAVSRNELVVAARQRFTESCGLVLDELDEQRQRQVLNETILWGFSQNLLELHVRALPLVALVSECPVAAPLARLQAEGGEVVTNQRLEQLHLDALHQQLILLLDGTRDRSKIVDALTDLLERRRLTLRYQGELVTEREGTQRLLREQLEASLKFLAESALLVA